MRTFLIPMLAAVLCGCSTTIVHESPNPLHAYGAQVDATALVEALLAWKGTLVQAVDGAWRDRTFQAQSVLKGDGEKLTLVFLAPQMRLATIQVQKPHVVQCEHVPQIPRSFEPEYALADAAYVNLETDVLRRVLAPSLRVEESGSTRRILSSAGETVAEVERRADGETVYRNLEHGYTYTLKTIQ